MRNLPPAQSRQLSAFFHSSSSLYDNLQGASGRDRHPNRGQHRTAGRRPLLLEPTQRNSPRYTSIALRHSGDLLIQWSWASPKPRLSSLDTTPESFAIVLPHLLRRLRLN